MQKLLYQTPFRAVDVLYIVNIVPSEYATVKFITENVRDAGMVLIAGVDGLSITSFTGKNGATAVK
jgi:hypothetical protein